MKHFNIRNHLSSAFNSAFHSVENGITRVGDFFGRKVTFLKTKFSSLGRKVHDVFVRNHPKTNSKETKSSKTSSVEAPKNETEADKEPEVSEAAPAEETEAAEELEVHEEAPAEETEAAEELEVSEEAPAEETEADKEPEVSEEAPENKSDAGNELANRVTVAKDKKGSMITSKKAVLAGASVLGLGAAYLGYQNFDYLQGQVGVGLNLVTDACSTFKESSLWSESTEVFRGVSSTIGGGVTTAWASARNLSPFSNPIAPVVNSVQNATITEVAAKSVTFDSSPLGYLKDMTSPYVGALEVAGNTMSSACDLVDSSVRSFLGWKLRS